ncbi:MAG TPA: MBL fold metallo-hydrolase [Acidimicrobiia bacterium]|jgi:glyoxylase-like metal-dependent hydrolase (beta-lactamase superfamily II)|nr:MBL fold metallo-hydrolase [Acidimicrobiia bacterium]
MARNLNRRYFLGTVAKGSAAIAVFGTAMVACSDDDGGAGQFGDPLPEGSSTTSLPDTTAATTDTTAAPTTTTAATSGGAGPTTLERVSLGFVSAYVLMRNGEAAIVDTGVPGSEGQIEAGLGALGLGWDDVGHVILTHLHGDHIGSLPAVLGAAAGATGYAGEADIPGIASPRPLTPLGDGDRVFDLEIIATPGHTPGHVAVLDPVGGILVVGDAMNGGDAMGGQAGTVAGANPQFTPDLVAADDSIRKLAAFDFDAIYFGHGEPVLANASQLVVDFAAAL